MWVGTERGIDELDLSKPAKNFVHHYYSKEPEISDLHNYVYRITSYFDKDSTEVICWSTKRGLKIIVDDSIQNFQYDERPASFSFFRDLYAYKNQNKYLLLGSEMGLGLFDIEKKAFTKFFGNFNEHVQLSHNTVTAIFIDDTGVLWVGTKKGINKFDTYSKNFERYLTDSFDPTKGIITGLQMSVSGKYWVSTMGGGIYQFEKENGSNELTAPLFKRYKLKTLEEDDFSDFVQKLATDKRGNVWIGSAGAGVYSFKEQDLPKEGGLISSFNHYRSTGNNEEHRLSDDYVMSFGESADGGMWVGTWSGGINKILPGGKVLHYQQPELTQAPVVVLYEDDEGVLWIGTRGKGMMKAKFSQNELLSLRKYQHSSKKNALSNDFINAIYEDKKGKIWVGTEGGLNLFDKRNERFDLVRIALGDDVEVIEGILEDNQGKLWLSHWNGITVIDPRQEYLPVVNEYDMRDRIQGGFFYNNVTLKDPSGSLFFGGANGFNIIYPERVTKNPFKPKIELRDFRLFNNPVKLGEEYNGRVILDKSLSQTAHIFLKYFENSLSLEFAALHFSVPEKNRYAYRLKGFDKEWKYTNANRRYANYTNLPPGDFIFEVKASNNDGIWSDEAKQLKITVLPPWWKTWYAYVGYTMLFLLILYGFRRFIIIRTNYINDIKLERINRENIEKLNKAKLQFFTNVSHEFRTPLTLILGPLRKNSELRGRRKSF